MSFARDTLFLDRGDGGRQLAAHLARYAELPNLVVLALPRGGVEVAFQVARALHAPLDVFLVRKLGVPGHEELAMGAIASGGALVVNEQVLRTLQIAQEDFELTVQREQRELARRERAYRKDRPALEVHSRPVILVDDGLATGSTMQAAIKGLRERGPERIIVAVPVAAEATCERLRPLVDDIVCLATPEPFYGVGQWYEDFRQLTDDDVRRLLEEANRLVPAESNH